MRWLLIFGAAGGCLGMLVPYFVAGLHAVFIAAALIGASSAIYVVSLQNLVGLLSSTHDRARNFSNFSLMMSVANFVGPLLAGFSIDHSGHAVSCRVKNGLNFLCTDTRGVVGLTLTCGHYTAINMAQVALKPEMEPGKQSTLR